MDKADKLWNLKESLPEGKQNRKSRNKETRRKGLSKEKAEEIVAELYLQIAELENELVTLSTATWQTNRDQSLKQLRFLSEKMTCYLRTVIFQEGSLDEDNLPQEDIKELPHGNVSMEATSYGYVISCPFRLPSKNTYRVNEYWWGMIERAVMEYAKTHELKKMSQILIVYLDLYPVASKAFRVTDADNQDIKRITDIIRCTLLSSDDSLHLWTLQMGAEYDGSIPISRIHVVEKEKIPEWYALMGPKYM